LAVAVTTVIALRVEKRWTKRSPEAAMASSGIATLAVFFVATGTLWWSTKNFSPVLSYFIASVAFLIILCLLRRFSIGTLREQPSDSAETWWKENAWKEMPFLLRLGYAPIWPVATALGVFFYRAKLKERVR
jgi:hypothetical protein